MKRRLVKYSILLICWMVVVCLFLRPADSNYNPTFSDTPDFNIPSNQIGPCSFVRYDSKNNYRPLYSLSFDRLTLDNNNIGIFKSAVHQVSTLNNLKIKIFDYSQEHFVRSQKAKKPVSSSPQKERNSSSQEQVISSIPLSKTSGSYIFLQQIGRILSQLGSDIDGPKVGNFNIESTNISELMVNGFEYTLIRDNDLVFTMQCKTAIASYKDPGLALRGRVVVKSNSNKILNSNHVVWDLRSDIFIVKGVYALNTTKTVQTGQNILLDYQLNQVVSAKETDSSKKEEKQCYVRL